MKIKIQEGSCNFDFSRDWLAKFKFAQVSCLFNFLNCNFIFYIFKYFCVLIKAEFKVVCRIVQLLTTMTSVVSVTSPVADSKKSVAPPEYPAVNYLFRITACLEEIASRYRNAKVFTPVNIAMLVAELDSSDEASYRRVINSW